MTYSTLSTDGSDGIAPTFYSTVATIIFVVVSFTFFFPCNWLIPLDRRACAVVGATVCYMSRVVFFPDQRMNLVEAVDFDVLVLLAGIMAVNFIVVNQSETKAFIERVQRLIQTNPRKGFWATSVCVFVVSPFLTNDGVCLLFVEPILSAFESITATPSSSSTAVVSVAQSALHHEATKTTKGVEAAAPEESPAPEPELKLRRSDAFYFLITLACSSNIGSALTYTGNPQNMLVAEDAIDAMPPHVFLAHMLLPSLFAWVVTTLWIERCWMRSREAQNSSAESMELLAQEKGQLVLLAPLSNKAGTAGPGLDDSLSTSSSALLLASPANANSAKAPALGGGSAGPKKMYASNSTPGRGAPGVRDVEMGGIASAPPLAHSGSASAKLGRARSGSDASTPAGAPLAAATPATAGPPSPGTAKENSTGGFMRKVMHVAAPFPYAMLMLLFVMIAFIFFDLISIAGLICFSACVMVLVTVLGNHWQGRLIWADPNEVHPPLTAQQKIENTNDFFEHLFDSIDYSLLLIFMGLFVVLENVSSTGIPRAIWNAIVGDAPFKSVSSVASICVFVLVASQLLGNVPIIQLIRPNVEHFEGEEKIYVWSILSFVATIGGNLTIMGSAANIIVAEKAVRLDPSNAIDFFNHYRVCFWVTVLSSVAGVLFITATTAIQDSTF